MLLVNYRSLQRSFSKLPKSCQQWELTFLSTVVFRATKILATLRIYVPVAIRAAKKVKDTMFPVNYRSWQRNFWSYQNSLFLWELTFLLTIAFRATKIPTALRADVHFSITCGSTTQWITLFPLKYGCATLSEMWILHI